MKSFLIVGLLVVMATVLIPKKTESISVWNHLETEDLMEVVYQNVDINIVAISIKSKNTVGLCFDRSDKNDAKWAGKDQVYITVNQDIWDNLNDNEKKLLVRHEVGHCLSLNGVTKITSL